MICILDFFKIIVDISYWNRQNYQGRITLCKAASAAAEPAWGDIKALSPEAKIILEAQGIHDFKTLLSMIESYALAIQYMPGHGRYGVQLHKWGVKPVDAHNLVEAS